MTALVEQGIPGAVLYAWLTLWGGAAILQVKIMQRRGVGCRRSPALPLHVARASRSLDGGPLH